MRELSVVMSLAVLGAACSTPAPESTIDRHFGQAMRTARTAQLSDPQAPQRLRAPATLDGTAAAAGVTRYQRSFDAPSNASNVFNIGVGSTAGMGTK